MALFLGLIALILVMWSKSEELVVEHAALELGHLRIRHGVIVALTEQFTVV